MNIFVIIIIITVIYHLSWKYTIQKKHTVMRNHAQPANVIVNNNTGLKCWPCRATTPSDQFQAFLVEHADTTIFAWILDVFQL